MVHRTGVTVATGTGSPASRCCVILFSAFPPSLLSRCIDPATSPSLSLCPALYLSCHFSGNLSPQQFFPSLLLTPTCSFSPLFIPMSTLCNLVIRSISLSLCVSVCVGGCWSSSFHPPGSAPDPAALQAGGESRQERFPIPQEALPQRSRVSTLVSSLSPSIFFTF